jgi:hypothetical protein
MVGEGAIRFIQSCQQMKKSIYASDASQVDQHLVENNEYYILASINYNMRYKS